MKVFWFKMSFKRSTRSFIYAYNLINAYNVPKNKTSSGFINSTGFNKSLNNSKVESKYFNRPPLLTFKAAPCMSSSTKIVTDQSTGSTAQSTLITTNMTRSNSVLSDKAATPSSDSVNNKANESNIAQFSNFIIDNSHKTYTQHILPACFFIAGVLMMFYILHLA